MTSLMHSRIAKPWTVKIEFTTGCNLSCEFCPVHYRDELRNPDRWQFLSPKLCEKIALQLHDLGSRRIELTLRGEPTLNPHAVDNLHILRSILPDAQISMFSNGIKFIKDPYMVLDLLDDGLNILCVDCYNNTYDRFSDLIDDVVEDDITVHDYREFSAYKRHSSGHKLKIICLVPDLIDKEVRVRRIHNVAGNIPSDYATHMPDGALPLEKKCARAFREMVITSQGNILLCCHDWSEEFVLGNIKDLTLEEMWYGQDRWKTLCRLYDKDRNFPPCNKCDYFGGYRQGLIQNPFEDK